MSAISLDCLVLTDLHYVDRANHTCMITKRKATLGPVLIRKALRRLRNEGVEPTVLILLGDLVDNGDADGGEEDLAAIADAADETGMKVLVAPGNHDGDADRLAKIFDCRPGLHEVAGYGFLLFADDVADGDVTTRRPADLTLPADTAATEPGMPLVALQHNPLHPRIDGGYPYMLTNTDEVLAGYARAGVIGSLSGHYHRGQPAHQVDGVTFCTVPAAAEAPYRFAHLRLRGQTMEVRKHSLELPAPGLLDVHCHTEFAYCATSVTAAKAVEVAELMGLAGLCLTEHAFQLYLDREEAWSFRWQTDDAMAHRAMAGRGRMDAYKQFARRFRGDFVRLGLEVDLRADGSLLLAEQDRADWDLLVGAIHKIPEFYDGPGTQAEAERLFFRDTERLLTHDIDVLAHPFRCFKRAEMNRPPHLHAPTAKLLADAGVAVEINFHTNDPDVRFIAECLDRGVRVALGSDSHDLAEVADFAPHLEILREAGVRAEDLADVLYCPPM